MTRHTYQSKLLPVKLPRLVRSSSYSITSSGIRGSEVIGQPPACKKQRTSRRLSGERGARGRGLARTRQRSTRGSGGITKIPAVEKSWLLLVINRFLVVFLSGIVDPTIAVVVCEMLRTPY